jgi:23S rRNA (pseudouridine1915-N3)-methyltransferase
VHIRLVAVGKPRTPGLVEAIAGFERRAGRYWSLDVRVVRETPARSRPAEQVRVDEWRRAAAAAAGCRLVACDRDGEAMTSERFAGWLDGHRRAATDLAFVIGGAHGLPDEARAQAAHLLSLAPWTLPHELARLVLVEQLYRAGTILGHEPYHK